MHFLAGSACLFQSAAGAVDTHDMFDCLIEPHVVVELSSRVDGVIEKVLVDRGDHVEKDQVIVKLEADVERAALDYMAARAQMNAEIQQHKENVDYTRRNEIRINELSQKQAVSPSEIDRVRTEAKVAQYKLLQAQENKQLAELDLVRTRETLNQHSIRSPIRGVVVERYLNPGESVEERSILKLAQLDPLRVEVVVPMSEFGKIRKGQPALVYPESIIGGEYQSSVTVVDKVLDAASGTFRVRLALANPDYAITSGLKCRVTFQ